jgi:hypothetical protein
MGLISKESELGPVFAAWRWRDWTLWWSTSHDEAAAKLPECNKTAVIAKLVAISLELAALMIQNGTLQTPSTAPLSWMTPRYATPRGYFFVTVLARLRCGI